MEKGKGKQPWHDDAPPPPSPMSSSPAGSMPLSAPGSDVSGLHGADLDGVKGGSKLQSVNAMLGSHSLKDGVGPEGESPSGCFIFNLPPELLDAILSYLSPIELATVSLTCRGLHARAVSDYHWQALVQAQVPGSKVTSSYPCETFRDLWAAHDPRWFLTKHKVWFSGQDLIGKLIVVRYDQRRGCIEGYQLLAVSNRTGHEHWHLDEHVIIHAFEPTVKLHLDKPVLQLRCHGVRLSAAARPAETEARGWQEHCSDSSGHVSVLRLTGKDRDAAAPSYSGSGAGSGSGSGSGTAVASSSSVQPTAPPNRYAEEIPMMRSCNVATPDGMFSNFLLSRPLPAHEAEKGIAEGFPYRNVWPPPSIPARHRVAAANFERDGNFNYRHRNQPARQDAPQSSSELFPRRRSEISEQSFRIRSWMEMRMRPLRGVSNAGRPAANATAAASVAAQTATHVAASHHLHTQASHLWSLATGTVFADGTDQNPQPASAPTPEAERPMSLHMGEEITTYSTLDPELYTPTDEFPWRGIWVGDYSGHGCEFLLINQVPAATSDEDSNNVDDASAPYDESSYVKEEGETDEQFEARKRDARIYRGRLEAIKLTGDPNVPRGEYTFIVDDLGPKGFVNTVQDAPFKGARIVKSRGHVAGTGFNNDRFIDSQLLLISPNRLAQYWLGYGHISFFERVDIDRFLEAS